MFQYYQVSPSFTKQRSNTVVGTPVFRQDTISDQLKAIITQQDVSIKDMRAKQATLETTQTQYQTDIVQLTHQVETLRNQNHQLEQSKRNLEVEVLQLKAKLEVLPLSSNNSENNASNNFDKYVEQITQKMSGELQKVNMMMIILEN